MTEKTTTELMAFKETKGVQRIRDVDLGKVLGLARPTDIRRNIEKYLKDGKLNDSDVIAQRALRVIERPDQQDSKCPPVQRPVTEYWLTEEAALFVGGRSDAPNATKIMRMLIAAFEELRRQNGAISHVLEFYFQAAPAQLKERPFRELIRALLKLRSRDPQKKGTDGPSGNPPWGPLLASWIYQWSLKAYGQQEHRRKVNPCPSGSKVDYGWLTGDGLESCKRVIQTGTDFAKSLDSWEDWKYRMELAFGTKTIHMQLPAPPQAIPKRLSPKKKR